MQQVGAKGFADAQLVDPRQLPVPIADLSRRARINFGHAWILHRKLMLRFGLFYWALAILNEVVWRTQSESTWVLFRSFGLQVLTVAFALTQVPLLMRYMKAEDLPPPPTE